MTPVAGRILTMTVITVYIIDVVLPPHLGHTDCGQNTTTITAIITVS